MCKLISVLNTKQQMVSTKYSAQNVEYKILTTWCSGQSEQNKNVGTQFAAQYVWYKCSAHHGQHQMFSLILLAQNVYFKTFYVQNVHYNMVGIKSSAKFFQHKSFSTQILAQYS